MSEIGLMHPPRLGVLGGWLARVDPPDDEVATCRVCDCTDLEACQEGCWWVEDPQGMGDLCSSCADQLDG